MQICQLDFSRCDLFPDIVLLYRYVLSVRMKPGTVSECDSALVIDEYFCRQCRDVGGVNSWGSTVLGSSVLGLSGTVCSSAMNLDTHMASFAALVRAIYSASVEDSTIV